MTLRRILLPLVLGLTDGLLNALTLASSAILHASGGAVSMSLGLRVGTAALITAAFTMFVADYAERRAGLVRASRELNLTTPGRLAATRLGAQAFSESIVAMIVAAASSFIGAASPLLVGTAIPAPPWTILAITIGCLGVLGWLLGRLVAAHPLRWVAGMLIGGVIVTIIGVELHIA